MTVDVTGYWTFFCNPAKWEVDRFLENDPHEMTYMVTTWQADFFQTGQLGVIRVGGDRRTKKILAGRPRLEPGVYAIVEVVGPALTGGREPDEYWLDWSEEKSGRPFVELRILKGLLDDPLLFKDLELAAREDPYLVDGFQAASMPLSPSAFRAVRRQAKVPRQPEWTDTPEGLLELEKRMLTEKPTRRLRMSQTVERGRIGSIAKRRAGWECQICDALGQPAVGFQKRNGGLYAEAHHVVPVSSGDVGTLAFANVICVCASHHRQLHYGQADLIKSDERSFVFRIDGRRIKVAKTVLAGA